LKDLGLFYVDPGGLEQKYHTYLAINLAQSKNSDTSHNQQEIENLEI